MAELEINPANAASAFELGTLYFEKKKYTRALAFLDKMFMIIVSECLAGIKCKYSGGHNLVESIYKLVQDGRAVPVCPEELGGLPTPRNPAEIIGGTGADVLSEKARVVDCAGQDVTEEFIIGARKYY